MTEQDLLNYLNSGWTVRRSSLKSMWYRYRDGEPSHLVPRQLIVSMIRYGLIEHVSKSQLQIRIKQNEQG